MSSTDKDWDRKSLGNSAKVPITPRQSSKRGAYLDRASKANGIRCLKEREPRRTAKSKTHDNAISVRLRTVRQQSTQALPQLVLDPRLCYGQPDTGNAIIEGDNLIVLQMLAPKLIGSVRCIYIDPPYNNQEDYTHYEDRSSHDEWLQHIIPRIETLWRLLREDGSLWISIDDRELHYLKEALDKLCGRDAFMSTVVWEHRTTRENRRAFSYNHEYVIVYAKNPDLFRERRNRLPLTCTILQRYRNPDGDPRGRASAETPRRRIDGTLV